MRRVNIQRDTKSYGIKRIRIRVVLLSLVEINASPPLQQPAANV